MKINKGFNSIALVLAALILYLIFISSATSAATEQSTMPAGTYAYIPNDGNISVIDTVTNNVIATVHGGYPAAVAVMPDGTKVYVTNYFPDNNVTVIDTSTNNVIATVPVGADPLGIAITPDGKKAYVTNYGIGSLVNFDEKLNTSTDVFVIDTATNNVIATVPVKGNPVGVAVTPDGKKVYVTNCLQTTGISVIDTTTNTVTATVPVKGNPIGVAVTPDGTKVYVANQGTNSVFVIDTSTNNVIAIVPVGSDPNGIAMTPDGTKVYVTNSNNGDSDKGTVSVINTTRNNVITKVSVGGQPSGIAVTPDGKKVFVANQFDNNVSVINTETNNVITKINVRNQTVTLGQFIGFIPAQTDHPVTNFSTNISSSNGSNINTNVTVNVLQSGNNTSYFEKTFEQIKRQNTSNTDLKKSPGFDFVLEVVSLISLFLYKRK
jgi:YVTN family beta-propeller protein